MQDDNATNTAARDLHAMVIDPIAFRDILPKIHSLIPDALIDDPGWTRLLDCAGDLPAWRPLSCFGFEFRLGDPTPAADFFVRIPLSNPLAQAYVRRGEAAAPNTPEAALARFLAEASEANSRWGRLFDTAGLECDIAEVPSDRRAAPGVFLKLRATKRPPVPGIVADAIARAVGWRSDAGERGAFERVFAALPPGGRVGLVGALPGRKMRAIRVIAGGISPPDIPAFLQRLAYPGAVECVVEVLASLRDVAPYFHVTFDATGRGVGPRLGLEMGVLEHPDGPQWLCTQRRHWLPLVTRVQEQGWCLPAKAHGLLDFLKLQSAWDKTGAFRSYKGINHIKISIDETGVSAKGYGGMLLHQSHPPPVV